MQQQYFAPQTFIPTSIGFETAQQTNAHSTNTQQNDQSASRAYHNSNLLNTFPGSSTQQAFIPMNQQQLAQSIMPMNSRAVQVPSQTITSNVQHPWKPQQNHLPPISSLNNQQNDARPLTSTPSCNYLLKLNAMEMFCFKIYY